MPPCLTRKPATSTISKKHKPHLNLKRTFSFVVFSCSIVIEMSQSCCGCFRRPPVLPVMHLLSKYRLVFLLVLTVSATKLHMPPYTNPSVSIRHELVAVLRSAVAPHVRSVLPVSRPVTPRQLLAGLWSSQRDSMSPTKRHDALKKVS